MVQTVKNLTEMQETRVWSLGREDPLEKRMTPHSSTLGWRTAWTEEPDGHSPWGHKERVRHDGATNTFTFFHFLYMDGFQKHSEWKKLDTKNHTLYDPIYIKCLERESRLAATEHGVREEGRLLLNMGSFFRQKKHSKISLWCWLDIFCN